jgi:hypothetical protein
MTLSIISECHFAQSRYAECHIFIDMLNVPVLSVIMLSIVMLIVAFLIVMLRVVDCDAECKYTERCSIECHYVKSL